MSSPTAHQASGDSRKSPERDGNRDRDRDRSRKRKRRPHLNCAECRRLKLKCDRTVPCENCVKRSCQEICPEGVREGPRNVKKQARPSSSNDGDLPAARRRRDTGTLSARSPSITLPRADTFASEPVTTAGPVAPTVAAPHDGSPAQIDFSNRHMRSSINLNEVDPQSVQTVSDDIAPRLDLPAAGPFRSMSDSTNVSQTVITQRTEEPGAQSHGTLVISHTGSSKYLGPSAASEWLKDAEVLEGAETPGFSRAASPNNVLPNTQPRAQSGFPFSARSTHAVPSLLTLALSLPTIEEAEALVDSYYRYFGWSYEIISRAHMKQILEEAYNFTAGIASRHRSSRVQAQQLALLFIVLAMGALHNLELPPDDISAEEYLLSSEDCLARGQFMNNNTVPGVQTLIIMAHYHLETDKGRNGDSAWTLWGLAMRIVQAMGLHRDGEKWNLPPEVVEERRRIFWESHSAEIFQANCFSRPYAIPAEFIDTKFPTDKPSHGAMSVEPSYHTLKFRLAQIAKSVLQSVLCTDGPPYESIVDLYEKLRSFERSIPYYIRCRTALLALPSLYTDASKAEAESPALNKRDLRRTFEQYSLAMMISESIVNLYRPYFMRALIECPGDPLRTVYGQAYLSVVERSNVIIQIVCGLYALHPHVTARHWWCWYHAFNSAVCLGTLILMSPQNELVPIALGAMDQVIGIYTQTVNNRTSPRMIQNLRWLLRLRQRANGRIEQSKGQGQTHQQDVQETPDSDTETDAGLLGWRTRLIERVGQGNQKATSVSTRSPVASGSISTAEIEGVIRSIPQAIQAHVASDLPYHAPLTGSSSGSPPVQINSTDHLLHQFWDPMMLSHDINDNLGASVNWWDALSQAVPPPQEQ
ncbi:hypothetical protein C345_05536 [Cryptococcus neoformans A2-102-5]|nr:hypothetical protein C346_05647 [Cryptococcus neoformans var. grubii D17-1]OXG92973.1 hypothetical protein C345_05536 [Cryptococcus neoformans var. grubii A2-102-5]